MADSGDDLDYMLPANCPSPYFDSWDRHNSIAFSATKGLRNAPGENNCFVNCAVQVFWHLDVFRRSYRRLLGHTCMGNSCIFCALKVIFTQFQYSDKSSLHPDALRKALAETFANQQRFQLGHMDDAAECFENILRRIHYHIACNHNEDACSAPHCLPHQKFSMVVYEKVVCPCGASSSPLKFSEMVHYVSASALVAQSRMMQENGDALHPDRFGLLLRKAGSMGDVRDCPANCGKQVQKQRTLLNIPDVVSVGLVWDSDHPSMETTTEVAGALGTAILLQDMYHRVMPDVRKLPRLQLVAVVCYYGKHYSTFVFHSKLQTWVYFDDATVREIGPQWENVVERCSRGRFQPLLLLYANPSANPVPVDTAPRKRVMAPGYAPVGAGDDSEGTLDRTQENLKVAGNMAGRSTTPTPKLNPQNMGQGSYPAPGQAPEVQDKNGRDSPARLSREHSRQPSFLFAVTGKNDKNRSEGGEDGVPNPNIRRQLLDGGAAVRMDSVTDDTGNYADYTLSSGDQYRRPLLIGADTKNQLPMPPNMSRYPDTQRRDSFTKRAVPGKEKGGVDVVRYQVDSGSGGGHGTEFGYPPQSHTEGFPSQKGEMDFKPPGPHGRQRSLSSGREEEAGDTSGGSQHVVVKPKPTGHGSYEPADPFPHSAVQSGLATLPRLKAPSHQGNDPAGHKRSGSTHQEVAQLTRKGRHQCTAVNPPLPPGTPPPEYSSAPNQDSQVPPHSRQTSGPIKASASMGHIDQVVSSKKPPIDEKEKEKAKKKVKKEKKSEKDASSKKSEKDASSKKCGDKKKGKGDSNLKKSESEGDLAGVGGEKSSGGYIDRRMVENILKHQGVHRQNSSCSNNSTSSVDSDSLMGKLLASKGSALTVDIPFDNMSLGSQKDSGYGSSDRNSSSSTGSGTVDPYTQYFISKSMVVPRSVNTMNQQQGQYSSKNGDQYCGQPQPYPQSGTGGQTREDGRLIMHPIKESSQEDMLRLSPNEPIGTQKFIVANSVPVPPVEARPPPVPPKNFAQFQIIKSSNSSSTHERESSLDSLDKDESISDVFVSLCKKADALMDSCVLAETSDDIPSALCCCDQALGCLKEAMGQKELTSRALAYVQKKHNSCLLKSRMLQKRAPTSRQEPSHPPGMGTDLASSAGNRSSVTSSDSDMSDQLNRQPRPDSRVVPHQHLRRPHPGQDSSQGSRTMHERQHSASRQGGEYMHDRQHSASRQGGDHVHDRQHSASGQLPDNMHERQSSASRAGGEMAHERQHSASRQHLENKYEQQPGTSRQGRETNRQGQLMDARGQRDSSVPRMQQRGSGVSLESGANHHRTSSSGGVGCMPHSHSANYLQGGYCSGGENAGDMYGSLPRNKARRTTIEGPASVEAFQAFPNIAAKFRQTDMGCSQQSLDSLKSDSGSEHGSTGSGHRAGRQMPRDHQVQRQQRQAPSATQQQFATLQQQVSVPFSHQQDQGRQCAGQMSQRPPHHSGQSGQHFVSGHTSWQQQQQYSQQQYSHPQAAHNVHPSGSSYPRSSDGMPPPPPPSSALQGTSHGFTLPAHPSHTTSTPGPRPSSLPFHPIPQTASGGKPRIGGSQGQTSLPPHHNTTESSSEHLHSAEGSMDSQRCGTTEDMNSESKGASVSVRDLLSRFENTSLGRPSSSGSRPCSRHGSVKSDHGGVNVHRTRSKSESFSRKPKSVLKNKKNKSRPRKSVTFADSLALYANCDEANSGYESARELSTPRVALDDRAYYSDDEERRSVHVSYSDNELDDMEDTGSSNSEESPLGEDDACQLCHKRCNEPGKLFCAKCSFYMGKLGSS